MAGFNHPRCFFVFAIVCLILFIGSLVLALVGVPKIIDGEIAKSVRLDDFTNQWDRFIKLPFPIEFRVYMFEITNVDGVINGDKPILKETGPFVYHEHREKTIEELNENDTVTYRQFHKYHFSKELSGDLSDEMEVTVINPAMVTIMHMSSDIERYLLSVTNCIINVFEPPYNKLIITLPLKKLLWEGINFSINYPGCEMTNAIIRLHAKTVRNTLFVYDKTTGEVDHLEFTYFGFKNYTDDGAYTVNRGRDDIDKLGTITQWEYSNKLTTWGTSKSTNSDTCNKVRGTDSTLYPPYIKDDTKFEVFSTDICRTIQIKYKEEGEYSGITGYRFEADKSTLRSSLAKVEDDCSCTKTTLDENGKESCYLDGLIDMQPCFGSQVLFSFPHFLWADEKYLNMVKGLNPSEDKHKLYLLVEPNTGTPLKGAKRVQLNLVLRPDPLMTLAKTLPKAVLPLLWIDEGLSLRKDYVDELNRRLFDIVAIVNPIVYTLVGITAALTVLLCGLWFWKRATFCQRRKQYQEPQPMPITPVKANIETKPSNNNYGYETPIEPKVTEPTNNNDGYETPIESSEELKSDPSDYNYAYGTPEPQETEPTNQSNENPEVLYSEVVY